MTYEQALELKRIVGTDEDGNSIVAVDDGVEFEYYVTPLEEADFKSYISTFNPNTFTDFSATPFSSNQQFRLRLIGVKGTDKLFVNVDINRDIK